MNRESEAALLDFCARQQGAFQESAWLDSQIVNRQEMAAVCLFLAGVDWYGHKQRLAALARDFLAGTTASFESALRAVQFDCLRFSTLLRRRLPHA